MQGTSFKQASVAQNYIYRPPYPKDIYQAIVEQAPKSKRLLDLGCGEGKIARHMTEHFDHVTAVDPSTHMIKLGKSLENGLSNNLTWINDTAEHVSLDGTFDVVTFASSIHWMNAKRLNEKLHDHLATPYILAIIHGDTPFEPPWQDEWEHFLSKWLPIITGQRLNSDQWVTSQTKHLEHINVMSNADYVSEPFEQSIEDFIACQHSRETFAPTTMGTKLTDFDQELKALLSPYANDQGSLTYQVKSNLTLATFRALNL